jgi:hypothetical protein
LVLPPLQQFELSRTVTQRFVLLAVLSLRNEREVVPQPDTSNTLSRYTGEPSDTCRFQDLLTATKQPLGTYRTIQRVQQASRRSNCRAYRRANRANHRVCVEQSDEHNDRTAVRNKRTIEHTLKDPPSATRESSVKRSSGRTNCRTNRAKHWVRVERSAERNDRTTVRNKRTIEHTLNDLPSATCELSIELSSG